MYFSSKLYRIMALSMAILIFITSVGFTIDFHFCSGHLKSISLIGKAKSCHETAAKQCPYHTEKVASVKKQKNKPWDCCKNKIAYFLLEQDKQTENLKPVSVNPLQDVVQVYLPAFIPTVYSIQNLLGLPLYKPPQLLTTIFLLVQSFLL